MRRCPGPTSTTGAGGTARSPTWPPTTSRRSR
jgi:hypothetical protein